ncbi:hypothetical protein [Aerococcus viridans]|uniref:Uncharacterized protein n=1 Tax=Aerococcus viridans TaxID=1377 RepID=A0A2J9PLH3_9LACT|nr:hypothetical protein [Aerococcus viridans]PNL90830.1 hypothetical protein A6J77_000530 [Aerococcus viridans]
MTTFNNQTTKRFYFDTPQTDKLQAFTTNYETGVLTSATFTNTSDQPSKITITLNGADILYEYEVAAGTNEVLPFNIVLESGDIVYIKQTVLNAVNVSLNGSVG